MSKKKILKIVDAFLTPAFWKYFSHCRRLGVSLDSFQMCYALKRLVVNANTIIDVGSNKGQFLGAACFFFPSARIMAVEANPEISAKLEERFAGRTRVNIICAALGEKEEDEKIFNLSSDTQASSFLSPMNTLSQLNPQAVECREIKVKMRRLDDIVEGEALKSPVVMKVDVQGYELNVLRGATEVLDQTGHLVIEASFQQLYSGECSFRELDIFLEKRGFVPESVVGVHRSKEGHYPQVDLCYRRREV